MPEGWSTMPEDALKIPEKIGEFPKKYSGTTTS
jgi:hypothetical protein